MAESVDTVERPQIYDAKTYNPKQSVGGLLSRVKMKLMESLERGVEVPSGERLKAKRAALVRSGEKNSWIEIVLDEGKNRQIRRMLDGFGVEVLRLVRVAIGPLQLGGLAKGAFRSLRPEEKAALDLAIANSSRPRSPVP